MREKEKFGKKPVRRSTSDEKEAPKVYKPRTNKPAGFEPKKERAAEGRSTSNDPAERKQRSTHKEKDDRNDRYGEKKNLRREGRRDDVGKEESRTYKPRTLRTKSSDKDSPRKEKPSERERDFQHSDDQKKSYYEEKYSKPPRERAPKPSIEKTQKSSRDKYSKTSNERYAKPKFDKCESPISEREKRASKKFTTPPEIDNELKTDKDGLIRLNKYIANSGLCSRREADEFITKGQITVNGLEVRELGTKVKLTDEVRFKDKALDPEKKVYILLNKPKDYVTTVEDPNATRTVMDLIQGACEQRVYPVGRLDRNSTGLLLFTNDGELTKQLTHPSFMKKKIYEVGLDKNVSPEDMEAIRTGVDIEGEMIAADAIEYADDYDKSIIGIEIHSGQNRIVRRIFEKLGYRVQKLDRVYFAGLTKKNLPRGKWRFLSAKEVNILKMNRFS